jgi:flagellar biosynthesis/type III secretory pathway M-ring protein FliF/YscJ
MIKLLAQIILAIRSDDVGGWMNILVVVLLAVFWAIWGILKARAKKNESEDDEEQGDDKKPLEPTAHRTTAKAATPKTEKTTTTEE